MTSPKNTQIPINELNEALQKSETKYRNLVETSNDLIWSVDANGNWNFLNRKATLQIYGYEPEEMLGKHFTVFEPIEQTKKDLETFERVKSGISFFRYETIHIRKDGKKIELSFNAIVTRDSDGNVIGATGTATDITEKKKHESFLREKTKQLLEYQKALLKLSKMDFSDFQSSLKAITKTASQALNVERVSFWTYTADRNEIICQDLFTQKSNQHLCKISLKAKDYPRYFKALEENLIIASEDVQNDSRTNEFKKNYLAPLGITSMMDVPVRLHGEVVGILCNEHVGKKRKWGHEEQDFATSVATIISTGLLISQLKEAKNALQTKTNELERSNKALEEFAYIASHDLQEPLYIITAFLDNIRDKYETTLDKQVNFLIHRVYNAALRMTHLIQDLLNYARVNTRKKPFENVDLNLLIKDVWNDLELRAKEAHAELMIEKLPSLLSDRLQMTQLFTNLISNALKFKKGNKPTQIKIFSKHLSEKMAEIIVEDNGIGFEEEYVDKVFQPFQRLHPKNEYEGSGMGLAICKKIVERHQGNIRTVSKPDRGTQFIIQLPYSQ